MNRPAGRLVWGTLFMLSIAGLAGAGGAIEKAPAPVRMKGFHIDMNIAQFTRART